MDREEGSAQVASDQPRKRGRKRSVIGEDEDDKLAFEADVHMMRTFGMNWKDICVAKKVNSKFLNRWRKEVGFVDPQKSTISDDELDNKLRQYIDGYPARGEKMLDACLAVDNCRVTRKRLRASMKRVDPEGVEKRRRKAIHRREYNVEGPHHLWHVDGNHKLIKFNMVIHAGIDGFSRHVSPTFTQTTPHSTPRSTYL